MQTFTLYDDHITLGQVLKELGLIATGGQAKIFLAENADQIFVNGEAENRRGRKLRVGDRLEIHSEQLSVAFTTPTVAERAARQEEEREQTQLRALSKANKTKNVAQKTTLATPPKSPFHR